MAGTGIVAYEIMLFSDTIVNILLVIELTLNVIATKNYFRGPIHVIESLLILINTTDVILSNTQIALYERYEGLKYLGVLKALLFFRVINYNYLASNMIHSVSLTFPSYANLTLLLFFLITNYALFGI